jgi:ABC-2 type transport system ATP-binding protein
MVSQQLRVPSVLQFEAITKQYRTFWSGRTITALDEFSLSVEQGEVFGFLGPNGAGKTTAIHLAMGFMRPTRGHGYLLGKPFGTAAMRKRVGFLAENVAFYHRPALRLVEFYGALSGLRDPDLARRAREVLEAFDLSAERDRNVGKFSRGMLQRLGLAQALVNDPDLLVLDEPTSALDPLARIGVREILIAARNAGKTVFLSSHLLSEVETICTRVAIVRRGRIVRAGKTNELLESRQQSEIIARGEQLLRQFAGAQPNGEGYRLVVPACAMRETIERLWSLGAEVVRVNPMRKSLEEIFVELTAEPQEVVESGSRQAGAE